MWLKVSKQALAIVEHSHWVVFVVDIGSSNEPTARILKKGAVPPFQVLDWTITFTKSAGISLVFIGEKYLQYVSLEHGASGCENSNEWQTVVGGISLEDRYLVSSTRQIGIVSFAAGAFTQDVLRFTSIIGCPISSLFNSECETIEHIFAGEQVLSTAGGAIIAEVRSCSTSLSSLMWCLVQADNLSFTVLWKLPIHNQICRGVVVAAPNGIECGLCWCGEEILALFATGLKFKVALPTATAMIGFGNMRSDSVLDIYSVSDQWSINRQKIPLLDKSTVELDILGYVQQSSSYGEQPTQSFDGLAMWTITNKFVELRSRYSLYGRFGFLKLLGEPISSTQRVSSAYWLTPRTLAANHHGLLSPFGDHIQGFEKECCVQFATDRRSPYCEVSEQACFSSNCPPESVSIASAFCDYHSNNEVVVVLTSLFPPSTAALSLTTGFQPTSRFPLAECEYCVALLRISVSHILQVTPCSLVSLTYTGRGWNAVTHTNGESHERSVQIVQAAYYRGEVFLLNALGNLSCSSLGALGHYRQCAQQISCIHSCTNYSNGEIFAVSKLDGSLEVRICSQQSGRELVCEVQTCNCSLLRVLNAPESAKGSTTATLLFVLGVASLDGVVFLMGGFQKEAGSLSVEVLSSRVVQGTVRNIRCAGTSQYMILCTEGHHMVTVEHVEGVTEVKWSHTWGRENVEAIFEASPIESPAGSCAELVLLAVPTDSGPESSSSSSAVPEGYYSTISIARLLTSDDAFWRSIGYISPPIRNSGVMPVIDNHASRMFAVDSSSEESTLNMFSLPSFRLLAGVPLSRVCLSDYPLLLEDALCTAVSTFPRFEGVVEDVSDGKLQKIVCSKSGGQTLTLIYVRWLEQVPTQGQLIAVSVFIDPSASISCRPAGQCCVDEISGDLVAHPPFVVPVNKDLLVFTFEGRMLLLGYVFRDSNDSLTSGLNLEVVATASSYALSRPRGIVSHGLPTTATIQNHLRVENGSACDQNFVEFATGPAIILSSCGVIVICSNVLEVLYAQMSGPERTAARRIRPILREDQVSMTSVFMMVIRTAEALCVVKLFGEVEDGSVPRMVKLWTLTWWDGDVEVSVEVTSGLSWPSWCSGGIERIQFNSCDFLPHVDRFRDCFDLSQLLRRCDVVDHTGKLWPRSDTFPVFT